MYLVKPEREYSFDIDSFREISFEDYEKDFTFVVNNKKYRTPRIIADILSPKIRQYHLVDKTFDTFYIYIPNTDLKCNFSSILSLTNFETKNYSQKELDYFRNIFFLLCNKKEFVKLTPKYDEPVSTLNVFERISIIENYTKLRELNKNNNRNIYGCPVDEILVGNDAIRQEIDFISSHFCEIDTSKVKKLSPSIIEDIISNTKLQLNDEDSLLRFVMDIYKNDHSLAYLFERINFLNVSQKVFIKFSALIQFDDISLYIWNSINEKIANLTINPDDIAIKNQSSKLISKPYSEIHKFRGIIDYLTEQTGSNLFDNRTIDINASSIKKDECHPKNLINYDFKSNAHYSAKVNDKQVWVAFDFKEYLVKINSYTIRSCASGANGNHWRNWVIETSEDGINWNEKVDERTNVTSLNKKNAEETFILKKETDFVRFVRIRQTGPISGPDNLWFRAIEFYGFIKHI